MTVGSWTVHVDDNFNYMDEDERYTLGTFDSYESAVSACKKIVDAFLQESPAKTAEELFERYTSFGEDPWIEGPTPPGSEEFSAWDYARQRCNEFRPNDASYRRFPIAVAEPIWLSPGVAVMR